MGVSQLQPSFASGELGPALTARVDVARYQTGLKLCRNFYVLPYGGVRNRPGMRFLAPCRGAGKVRLLPFQFNDEQAYALEFGAGYMRVVRNGGLVLEASKSISAITNASPAVFTVTGHGYQVGDWVFLQSLGALSDLGEQYAVVASITADTFTLNDTQGQPINASGLPAYTGGGSAARVYTLSTPYTEAQLFDLNITQSADVLTIVHPAHPPKQLSRLGHDNWTLADISFLPKIATPATATASGVGGTGNAVSWGYQITAVRDEDGVIEESLPKATNYTVTHTDKMQASVSWAAVTGATYYNVYKDNTGSGVYGFVGRASNTAFTDTNIVPQKTDTPPVGDNPFSGAGNYPGAVGYYQQRLCFAGTDNQPQTMWMSRTGNFTNFGYSTPFKDDDAITFTIASREVNRYRHLLPLRLLIGLTTGGEWEITGNDSGVTAKSIRADIQSYNGSSKLPPIVVNASAIYVQARGSRVSSLQYSYEADGFAGTDLTRYSPHFFQGRQVVDWAFQQAPDAVVWAARDDGTMLGLTYLPEEQLVAWHQHATDGAVESMCSIPEGKEDALYLVVRRTVGGVARAYLERMETRYFTGIENAFFVDSGLSYDGRNSDAGKTLTLSGGTAWGYPEQVTLTATGHSPFTASSIGRVYRFGVGDETVRATVLSIASGTQATVRLEGSCPAALRGVATASWALMATTLKGLRHLEGKTVACLADGDVHPQLTVAGGSVTLQYPAAVIAVGLPYVAELQTLEIESPDGQTVLDKRKVINSVTALVEESRGFWAGANASKVYEQKPEYRTRYDAPIAPYTGTSEIKIPTSWSTSALVYVQQPDPLPLTVLALIPEVTVSGKG